MGQEGALCLLDHLTFDLEGLATATKQVRHLRARSGSGSPPAPRKASNLERKSTSFKSTEALPYTFYKTFYGKKIDYYWHIPMGFVYNEEYDSSKE
ncbi:hypothetical protein IHV12_05940 [Fictibacillus sp. 7GRE50]|uniref:hypothetical protein n=1 Tax=Fictibacillus sp. 7GRE50 TaxID=2745878 RepID=UPI0018CE1CE0|nr:hypothetical protein [Fictibacillus sp. 7GRE50]MBH0164449.1 hypothetical protein [Fictibacillus sp. 7GRE50]